YCTGSGLSRPYWRSSVARTSGRSACRSPMTALRGSPGAACIKTNVAILTKKSTTSACTTRYAMYLHRPMRFPSVLAVSKMSRTGNKRRCPSCRKSTDGPRRCENLLGLAPVAQIEDVHRVHRHILNCDIRRLSVDRLVEHDVWGIRQDQLLDLQVDLFTL